MAEEEKAQRAKSTIQFPYRDLESSVAVARAIQRGGSADGLAADQLAGELGINGGTGNFLGRVGAARLFGLIGSVGGKYRLTSLGYEILDKDEQRQKAARVQAFYLVQLYRKTYDAFRGRPLPSLPHGLERTFIDFGVAPKQKDNARLAFEKSARFAGFFGAGDDRLVEPVITGAMPQPDSKAALPEDFVPTERVRPAMTWSDAPPQPTLPHFVQGLLEAIPSDRTKGWPLDERLEWLKLAVHSFNLMFKNVGEITVSGTAKAAPAAVRAPVGPAPKASTDDDLGGGRPAARGGGGKPELDDDIPF